MILKGNERGNAGELARHLLKAENEHVELHELRGFVADDLRGALQEAQATARGTRCRNFLFSLSLNPPDDADVPVAVFETAIEMIEQRLGLEYQPRAVVFHEKEGRRHAHCVWSRIDAQTMTARNLSHYKRKLNDVARELYLEHGWDLPKGFIDRALRDPLRFSQAEWQQAKRTKQDPRLLKAAIRECWQGSDTREAFETALRERGFRLAKGDRRGFVLVDWRGETYSLSRCAGAKTKDLTARLGEPDTLPSVDAAKAWIAERMTEKLKSWAAEMQARAEKQGLALAFQREQMVQRHRKLRAELKQTQERRQAEEQRERAAWVPKGVKAVWSWITGRSRKIRMRNELDAARCDARDQAERQEMIARQLHERRGLQRQIVARRAAQHEAMRDLDRDITRFMELGAAPEPEPARPARTRKQSRDRSREQRRGHDHGPELEP